MERLELNKLFENIVSSRVGGHNISKEYDKITQELEMKVFGINEIK